MKVNDLIPCYYRKYRRNTNNSNHRYKLFDNLLERDFKASAHNKVWVGDITYIRTNDGWLYLATVIDLFSRRVIGYKMSSRMTKDLVVSALLKALRLRKNPTCVIFHSDRGSQYASKEYKAMIASNNIRGSMSRKGDCWDNAVAESFFATLKKEYISQTQFKTREQAKLGIFDYIETWYNKERIHSYLNGDSPIEFEMKYCKQNINDTIKLGSYHACGF
ncbi:MAG: IS3 family transposase [Burkholderiales bacterium]|nr:IS3 family transposase [Burkholderiales bacterium]